MAQQKHEFDQFLKETEEKFRDCNLKINEKVYEFWKKIELQT